MSTGERTAEDRAAAIEALTATLNAGLDADEKAANRAARDHDGRWQVDPGDGSWGDDMIRAVTGRAVSALVDDMANCGPYQSAHIARHDPARTLRDVKAGRDLITAILAEPHDYNPCDEYYSCSQAEDPDPPPGEGGPGSGCADDDRAGQPCDCGRDARVERLLRILAGVYEDGGGR